MRRPTLHETLLLLRSRNTIAGLSGLIVGVLELFGIESDEAMIAEILLVLVSILAIISQQRREHHGEWVGRGGYSGDSDVGAGDQRDDQADESKTPKEDP